MELFDRHSHHASKDLTLGLAFDKYGQPIQIKGRGFRHVNIYELIPAQTAAARRKGKMRKVWVETVKDRTVLWESSARWSGTVEQVLAYRDAAHPKARVIVWDEEEGFVLWDEPPVTVTRKRK
jgi:hypothetical protein